MPAEHKIDHQQKIVITIWCGDADDLELVSTFSKYLQSIINQCPVPYDEILDFSEAGTIKASNSCIKTLARMAAARDVEGVRTRLAIVAGRKFAFGLGRMYASYRDLYSENGKEVRIFLNCSDAMEWMNSNRD